MNLSRGSTQNIETDIYPVTYRVYSYDTVDNRTEQRLGEIISTATSLLGSYAKGRGLPLDDCGGNQTIEFFIVPYSVLNDRGRFSEWPYENGAGSSSSNIVALFSPRRTESNIDAIMFTKDSFSRDHYVAHELAHYWYERLCWSSSSTVRTEPFAMGFESYYLSNHQRSGYTRGNNHSSDVVTPIPTIRGGGGRVGGKGESHNSYIPTIRGGGGRGGGK